MKKQAIERSLCRVLVIDDHQSVREGCIRILEEAGYQVDCAGDGAGGIEKAQRMTFDVILLDLKLPDQSGMDVLTEIKKTDQRCSVIMITAYPTVSSAVEAVKRGAFDYISKPFTPEQLLVHVDRAARIRFEEERSQNLRKRLLHSHEEVFIVANSPAMKKALELAEKVAPTDSTVLITGESGTGKEVLAEIIHKLSPRKEEQFVAIDCSAIAEGVVESELFGHIKGAFTGAWQLQRGCFELASGGTMFLDEIGNLNISIQSKLLRAIQEKEIKRVGDPRPLKIDIRIISATNRDLQAEVRSGRFRQDLFFRLNVFPIKMPPLRERKEDIIELAEGFVNFYSRKHGKLFEGFSEEAIEFLLNYQWPGNIRELKNLIERAVIMEEEKFISVNSMTIGEATTDKGEPQHLSLDVLKPLREIEAEYIMWVLNKTGWNKKKTAKILGIDTKTLYSKIKKHGLKK